MDVLKVLMTTRLKQGKLNKIKGIKMFNVRLKYINEELTVGMSAPCCHCCRILKQYGLQRIFYSDNEGNIKESYLDNEHISRGNRRKLMSMSNKSKSKYEKK